ncbi:unnamed protein product [Blepharisma stoltei]|uniref:Biogenesis of lysosome-related organelles complex 1 subunit 2 n=1 Tax=Blepharisma stoltei TaxID=1481888 RepID=A0AAU9JFH8_9CILI|nr:unnamed protein product [Blepharisma stoltei]
MESESVPKSFVREFLRATRMECLESNLNLELIGKMNDIANGKYKGLIEDVENIEENLKSVINEYQLSEEVVKEIEGLKDVLDQLESSVDFLEEMTTRIETKVKTLA